MSLVVGLIGSIGSGKTVVAEHLMEKHKAKQLRYSGILEDVVERLSQETSRANLQNLGIALRGVFGDDVLAKSMKNDIKNEKARIIIIDGLRYPDEVKMLREFPNNILLFVTSPLELRYKRTVERGLRDEGKQTLREFMEREKAATEKHINALGMDADYIINNTGTIKKLKKEIDDIISKGR